MNRARLNNYVCTKCNVIFDNKLMSNINFNKNLQLHTTSCKECKI